MPIPDIVPATQIVDAEFWVKAANHSVRNYCRWHVAPVITETLVVDGSGTASLLIRSKHVLELVRVVNDGEDVTDRVDVSEAGALELRGGRFTRRLGRVTVELRHGWKAEEVPLVAALIVTVAARGKSGARPVVSQGVGGASVAYATQGGAPLAIPLLKSEERTLDPYRIEWGA